MSAEEPRSDRELPKFSNRLGAPIATIKPVGRPPSQVTGLPSAQPNSEQPSSEQASSTQPSPSQPTVAQTSQDTAGSQQPGAEQQSFYEAIGGRKTFQTIVDVFYDHVAEDEDFRAMYPEEDLTPAKERLLTFLEQYWGGPKTYQEQRGHPRLRMRHMPFAVDAQARDKWLSFMRAGVEAAELSPLHEQILWDYLERAAHSMVNS